MAVQAVTEPSGYVEGATTRAAKNGATAGGGIGGGIGAALAAVVVFAAAEFGGDWSPIEWALNVIFSAVIGALGARWLTGKAGAGTPTDQRTEVVVPIDMGATSQVNPPQAHGPGESEVYSAEETAYVGDEDPEDDLRRLATESSGYAAPQQARLPGI